MKIFFYSHDYYKGGIDTFLINLLSKLHNKNKFELVLFTSIFHPSTFFIKSKLSNQIKVKKLYLLDTFDLVFFVDNNIDYVIVKKFFKFCIILLKFPIMFFNFIFLIFFTLFNKPNYFFLVSGGFPCSDIMKSFILTKKLLSNFIILKLIFNFHNFPHNLSNSKLKTFYNNFIANFIFNNSNHLITVSNAVLKSMGIYKLNTKQKNKLCFVHNGIETITKPYNNNLDDIKLKYGLPLNSKIHLILGTLDERKGHKFLLNIFKKLIKKDSYNFLLICGHGSPNEILQINELIYTNKLNNYCSLMGHVDNLNDIFSITDYLLIGSQFGESFGLPAIEAMSLKIPFISTDFGGLGEIILDGYGGYKSSYNDSDEYLSKLIYLHSLNNIDLQKLKNKGFKYFQSHFTASQMANKYLKFIK